MAEGNGKKPEQEAPKGSDGVELIPGPNGGWLRPGGLPGNKGGPGRPPNEIRERVRNGSWMVLNDVLDDWNNSRRRLPPRNELEKLKKADLVDLLEEIRSYTDVPWSDRRQLLKDLLDFGIGKKFVHTGGDEDGDQPVGVVVMPAIQKAEPLRYCPQCGFSQGG